MSVKITVDLDSSVKEFGGVVFLHSYYSDLICKDIDIVPTDETKLLLRNLSMIFKPRPVGFLLSYRPDRTLEQIPTLPPKTRLTFIMSTTKYTLNNYSELPFLAEDEVFYYSNLSISETRIDTEVPEDVYYYFRNLDVLNPKKKLLHSEHHTKLKLKARNFYHQYGGSEEKGGVAYNDLSIQDEWGEDRLKGGIPYKRPVEEVNQREIQMALAEEVAAMKFRGLTGMEIASKKPEILKNIIEEEAKKKKQGQGIHLDYTPTGKYSLTIKKKSELEFYSADRPSESWFGIIDIYLTGPEGGTSPLYKGKDFNPQAYFINFDARKSYWRYYFLNYQDSKIFPKEVVDEAGEIQFTEPVDGRLEYLGTKAKIVESLQPIAIKEKPKHSFMLKRESGLRKLKNIKLPYPAVDMIKPERKENGEFKIYSDIYVYL